MYEEKKDIEVSLWEKKRVLGYVANLMGKFVLFEVLSNWMKERKPIGKLPAYNASSHTYVERVFASKLRYLYAVLAELKCLFLYSVYLIAQDERILSISINLKCMQ